MEVSESPNNSEQEKGKKQDAKSGQALVGEIDMDPKSRKPGREEIEPGIEIMELDDPERESCLDEMKSVAVAVQNERERTENLTNNIESDKEAGTQKVDPENGPDQNEILSAGGERSKRMEFSKTDQTEKNCGIEEMDFDVDDREHNAKEQEQYENKAKTGRKHFFGEYEQFPSTLVPHMDFLRKAFPPQEKDSNGAERLRQIITKIIFFSLFVSK